MNLIYWTVSGLDLLLFVFESVDLGWKLIRLKLVEIRLILAFTTCQNENVTLYWRVDIVNILSLSTRRAMDNFMHKHSCLLLVYIPLSFFFYLFFFFILFHFMEIFLTCSLVEILKKINKTEDHRTTSCLTIEYSTWLDVCYEYIY